MRFNLLAALAGLGLVVLGGSVRADYTYQFANASSGSAQTNFTVGVGQTVDIRVYVLETGGTTTLHDEGLYSGGVELDTQTPSAANVTAVTPNAAFTGGSNTGTGSNAFVNVFSAGTAPNSVTASNTDPTRILLGTFTFTGMSAGQTLTVTALPGLNPDNVLGDGTTSIDSNLANNAVSAFITVAVPEPGALMLTGLAASGLALGAWRRRRGAAADA
jgi:hypothetical protein